MKKMLDIVYREIGDIKLRLDIFLPDDVKNPPLILWIHGGAWMMGDRKWCGMQGQIDRGYAVASIDYRLSTVAPFPACIEDCKYALAFLRKNANQYPIDFSRVCACGDSAGGHLAALMGVTAGHTDWEPEDADCAVQAVIDFFGPTSLKCKKEDLKDDTVIDTLFGVSIRSAKGRMAAATASPINYVNGTEPPFLIVHGDMDETVPINQSYLLRDELEKYGQKVAMHTVFGGGHGFDSPAVEAVANEFLDYHFKGK
ncbi:MAG: alpha/beta hydrolase [Oscillospiraceae bacterium]|nr:alpha/beta hydrolase [Oscillospiraceae bacterium]